MADVVKVDAKLKMVRSKGQIILEEIVMLSILQKKRTENVCNSRLGQKSKFSSSFFGRIDDTKIPFRD